MTPKLKLPRSKICNISLGASVTIELLGELLKARPGTFVKEDNCMWIHDRHVSYQGNHLGVQDGNCKSTYCTLLSVGLWFNLTFEQSAGEKFGIPPQLADDEELDFEPALTQSEESALRSLQGEIPNSCARSLHSRHDIIIISIAYHPGADESFE